VLQLFLKRMTEPLSQISIALLSLPHAKMILPDSYKKQCLTAVFKYWFYLTGYFWKTPVKSKIQRIWTHS